MKLFVDIYAARLLANNLASKEFDPNRSLERANEILRLVIGGRRLPRIGKD